MNTNRYINWSWNTITVFNFRWRHRWNSFLFSSWMIENLKQAVRVLQVLSFNASLLGICLSSHHVAHLMNRLSPTFKKQYSIPYCNLWLNKRHNSLADNISEDLKQCCLARSELYVFCLQGVIWKHNCSHTSCFQDCRQKTTWNVLLNWNPCLTYIDP